MDILTYTSAIPLGFADPHTLLLLSGHLARALVVVLPLGLACAVAHVLLSNIRIAGTGPAPIPLRVSDGERRSPVPFNPTVNGGNDP